MIKMNGLILTLKLFCCFLLCHGFNIDIPSRVIQSSPQDDSWFGYSVAMYKHGSINTLLVGAPKFNNSEQPGVNNGGAVLKCSPEFPGRCETVPFDNRGNMRLSHMGFFIDNKSNQFFGATLKSRDGVVVACAPRYVWFTASAKRREPVGTCYVARNGLTDFQEFSPCRTEKWGYHRQGSCQAGFDAALTKDGERMYIGAPGAYYWQGQIHSKSLVVQNEYYTTGEGPAEDDDQYLGYSVTSGHFTDDDIQDVALGVPKGLNYTGKVVLFSHDLQWLQNITGDQLGSYFGYCLAVVDFNGDGLDDIVVGAPMYTDFEDREMKIEVGKVHVLLQNDGHKFREEITYVGAVSNGRFGLSVASLGDINLDKYGDFAVGAPYGGSDGKGAVFIYHGFQYSQRVLHTYEMRRPAQVIYASEAGAGYTTFGWSLAGGIDMDDNRYTDLLVGAYESEKVFLFKSRPIIKFLEHTLEFKSETKTIDQEAKNCEIERDQFYSCMELAFCIAYTGVNVDDKLELEVEYRLDTKQSSEQRLLFESNGQGYFREKVEYSKEEKNCRKLKTFLKQGIVDKLTPISANVSYVLIERRRSPRSLTPVLDRDQRLSMNDSLTIQKNCGPDNVCIPDLVLTFNAPDEFIIGQKEMLNVSVRVENRGEDAFESVVFISEPKGLSFNKFEPRENTSCSTRNIDGSSFVKCDIGNPLSMHHAVFFNVFFQQLGTLEEPKFEFLVTANSTNGEIESIEDNVARKVVEAKVDAQLTLFGSSDPESIIYNASLYQVPIRDHEKHFGPSLVHKYGLLSKGPSDVEDAEIIILWPSRTLSGNHLLYIMEQPVTVGNIRCDRVPDINPLSLKHLTSEERARVLRLSSLDSSRRFSSSDSTSEVDLTKEGSSSSQTQSKSGRSGFSSTSITSSKEEKTSSSSYSGSRTSSSSSTGAGGVGHSSSARGGGSYSFSSSSDGSGIGNTDGSYSYSSRSGEAKRTQSTGSISRGGASSSSYDSSIGSGVGSQGNYHSSSSHDESIYGGERGQGGYSTQGGTAGREYSYSYDSHGEQTSAPSSASGTYSSSASNRRTYSPSSRDGYRQWHDSSSTSDHQGGVLTSTSSENRGGIVLPSSGTGGKFSSSLFTVKGGGEALGVSSTSAVREHEQDHGSHSWSGRNTNREGGRQWGTGVSDHDTSYSQQHGTVHSSSSTSGGNYGHSFEEESRGSVNPGTYSSVSREHHYSSSTGDGRQRTHTGVDDDGTRNSAGGIRYSSSSSYQGSQAPETYSGGSYNYKYSSSSSSSSSSSDDDFYRQNEIESRKKREVNSHPQDEWENLISECGATLCTVIRCYTGRLATNDDVYIYVRSRLWVDTLNEEPQFKFPVDDVTISTRMIARANVNTQGISSEETKVYSKNIVTPIRSAKSLAETPPIPWWVILLATLAGILILLLIILILWKLGFFKRNRGKGSKS